MAEVSLVRVARPALHERGDVLLQDPLEARAREFVDDGPRNPDVGDDDRAGDRLARREHQGHLGGAEGDGERGLDGGPIGDASSAESRWAKSTATTGTGLALRSCTIVSARPESGVLSPCRRRRRRRCRGAGCRRRATPSPARFRSRSRPGRAARGHRGSAWRRPDVRGGADEVDLGVDAGLPEDAGDDEAVSPVVCRGPRGRRRGRAAGSGTPCSIAATTWRPAFSIRTADGTPMPSMVRRSASAHLVGVQHAHRQAPAAAGHHRGGLRAL